MLTNIENLIYKKEPENLDKFLAKLSYENIIKPNDINRDSILHLAVKAGNKEVVEVVLKYLKNEDKIVLNSQRLTSLELAIIDNKKELIPLLLENGLSLNNSLKDVNGNTVHRYINSCKILDIDMIKYLLNNVKDLDINQINGFGSTVLDCACANKKDNALEVVKLLLAHDATPYNNSKEDSLYYAVSSGRIETVKYLIKNYEFDINKKYYQANMPREIDKLGYFNLAHIAYYKGNHEVFKFLIELPEFHTSQTINELSKIPKHRVPKESFELLENLKEKLSLESVVQANDNSNNVKVKSTKI